MGRTSHWHKKTCYKHRNLQVYRTLLQRQWIKDGKIILNNKQAFKDLGGGTGDVFVEEYGENSENLGEVNRYTTEIGKIYGYICLSSSLLRSETVWRNCIASWQSPESLQVRAQIYEWLWTRSVKYERYGMACCMDISFSELCGRFQVRINNLFLRIIRMKTGKEQRTSLRVSLIIASSRIWSYKGNTIEYSSFSGNTNFVVQGRQWTGTKQLFFLECLIEMSCGV